MQNVFVLLISVYIFFGEERGVMGGEQDMWTKPQSNQTKIPKVKTNSQDFVSPQEYTVTRLVHNQFEKRPLNCNMQTVFMSKLPGPKLYFSIIVLFACNNALYFFHTSSFLCLKFSGLFYTFHLS